jgi:hypothetical protein
MMRILDDEIASFSNLKIPISFFGLGSVTLSYGSNLMESHDDVVFVVEPVLPIK